MKLTLMILSIFHHETSSGINLFVLKKYSDRKNDITADENDILDTTVVSQNVQDLKQDSKLDHIVDKLDESKIDINLLQETYLRGEF